MDKKWKCLCCNRTFNVKYRLDQHLLTHTSIKMYSCSRCPKQYAKKASLELHMRSAHLLIKPYRCVICEATFSRTIELKTHLVTHDKEARYSCLMCETTFVQKIDLLRHVKSGIHAATGTGKINTHTLFL